MAEFVNFQIPEDLKNLQVEVLTKVAKSGKIKIGINEVTKIIERNNAKLVVIAEDVSPAEIIMHVPVLCKDKKVPYTYVKTREELGKLAGINAKASSIVIMDEGVAKKEFSSLIDKISEIVGGKSEKKSEEKPKVTKEVPKKKDVKEEKPSEKTDVKEEKPSEKTDVKEEKPSEKTDVKEEKPSEKKE
jgi:large subunit ribosomal protein L7Ae